MREIQQLHSCISVTNSPSSRVKGSCLQYGILSVTHVCTYICNFFFYSSQCIQILLICFHQTIRNLAFIFLNFSICLEIFYPFYFFLFYFTGSFCKNIYVKLSIIIFFSQYTISSSFIYFYYTVFFFFFFFFFHWFSLVFSPNKHNLIQITLTATLTDNHSLSSSTKTPTSKSQKIQAKTLLSKTSTKIKKSAKLVCKITISKPLRKTNHLPRLDLVSPRRGGKQIALVRDIYQTYQPNVIGPSPILLVLVVQVQSSIYTYVMAHCNIGYCTTLLYIIKMQPLRDSSVDVGCQG